MTWPTVAVTTTNTDAGTDSPATARSDLLDALQKLNQMMAHVSTFGATLIDDTTAAAARSTIGAVQRASSTGLLGITNSATPNTKYDLSADAVVLLNATGEAIERTSTGTIVCDITLAGPVANGRDQAGALTTSAWVYIYFIWNGTTLATIASSSATAPTLPSGYTHWCFATALYLNSFTVLTNCWTRGNEVHYFVPSYALVAGFATTETSISLAAIIPPGALQFDALCKISGTSAYSVDVGLRTTFTWKQLSDTVASSLYASFTMPNVAQNVFYKVNAASSSFTMQITSFKIKNNG